MTGGSNKTLFEPSGSSNVKVRGSEGWLFSSKWLTV